MDEEIVIINEKTRNEKIKSFFIENKKIFIVGLTCLILLVLGFYSFQVYMDGQRKLISDKYNGAVIEYEIAERDKTISLMKEIILNKDSTYSPLALYFLIDNNLVENKKEVNELFNILINKTSLETEIKNLIIYKKALYNADFVNESDLLDILRPIINSNSIWKSHALYLVAEYFYNKNEKKKSKEFFEQIFNTKNANQDIVKKSQKRINRDFGE
jgi:hypothetical protein